MDCFPGLPQQTHFPSEVVATKASLLSCEQASFSDNSRFAPPPPSQKLPNSLPLEPREGGARNVTHTPRLPTDENHPTLPNPYSVAGLSTKMRLRIASSGAHCAIRSNS